MKFCFSLFACFFMIWTIPVKGRPYLFSLHELASPPPRIIRACCSFGSDLKFWGIPGIKTTDISCVEKLGPHHYLGDENEGNGIIYTQNGGFIDIAHLRDQADWTAYLYAHVLLSRQTGELLLKLGNEGGEKTLILHIPKDLDSLDALRLAGKIAYDLSVWHEIATWFGASYIPGVPERYSSFSIEDMYSNLLGVTLGIKALQSPMPYEESMTLLIFRTLESMDAVKTEAETRAAMEAVNNIWWTREKRLPSRKILLAHELKPYPLMNPWLVPDWNVNIREDNTLYVPLLTSTGALLIGLYELRFEVNHKFNLRKLFPERNERYITQNDFEYLINHIEKDINQIEN